MQWYSSTRRVTAMKSGDTSPLKEVVAVVLIVAAVIVAAANGSVCIANVTLFVWTSTAGSSSGTDTGVAFVKRISYHVIAVTALHVVRMF